jgi:hypothetical protein
MKVIFRRTGERSYAVIVQMPGREDQAMNPAPGFDPSIPHDLVHYTVEAELQLQAGVFGRAASGGGTFTPRGGEGTADARQRARARRKQARREQSMAREPSNDAQLRASERLAYFSDIAWRRKQGQKPGDAYAHRPIEEPAGDDAARVERIVRRLEALAPRWRALPVGGELTFVWPSLEPVST